MEKDYVIVISLYIKPELLPTFLKKKEKKRFDSWAKRVKFDDLTKHPQLLIYAQVYRTDSEREIIDEFDNMVFSFMRQQSLSLDGSVREVCLWNITDDQKVSGKAYFIIDEDGNGSVKRRNNAYLRKLGVI